MILSIGVAPICALPSGKVMLALSWIKESAPLSQYGLIKSLEHCTGLLQWRALPAVSGAGRRDWQPVAGLPQPLQQPGADVHGG